MNYVTCDQIFSIFLRKDTYRTKFLLLVSNLIDDISKLSIRFVKVLSNFEYYLLDLTVELPHQLN